VYRHVPVKRGTEESEKLKGVRRMRGSPIFIVLFAILLVLWLGGFLVFHVASALIHLLLILAVISLVLHFVRSSATP
jgi:bacteriorhodopsin